MLEANFISGYETVTVQGLTQWDKGQKLQITGLATLPATFQVHFANTTTVEAIVMLGSTVAGVGTVDIPNSLLESELDFKAWIYVIDAEGSETIKTILFPLTKRTKPADFISEPNPTEQILLEQTMTNVNAATANMQTQINSTNSQVALKADKIDLDTVGKRIRNLNKYMHVSFDDTATIFSDLATNRATYTSIFNNSTLAYYKTLHDTYGVVISLYCYLDAVSANYVNLTGYLNEFKANSDWLKFGLHAPNNSTNYASYLSANAETDWNNFVSHIVSFTGTYNSIDRMPRLHNFAGSLDACKAFRDCNVGALGFLSADDTRDSYYLSTLYQDAVTETNIAFTLESGAISGGSNTVNATRVRSTTLQQFKAGTRLKLSSPGYMIAYIEYTSDGTYVNQAEYSADIITIPHNGYYRFVIKTTAGTDDLSGQISAISNLLSIKRYTISPNQNKRVYPISLESGSILDTGVPVDHVSRLRSTTLQRFDAGTKIYFPFTGSYMVSYTEYTSDGTYVTQAAYSADTITIPRTGFYRITIKSVLGDAVSLSSSVTETTELFAVASDFNAYTYNHDKSFDSTNQLTFISTDLRMESITNMTATLSALSSPEWGNKVSPLVIFTHEWQLSDSTIKTKLEQCCQYAVTNGYAFDFPMNRI